MPLWDLSNLIEGRASFAGCTSLANLPLWSLSNMNYASQMFKSTAITSVPAWDLNTVITASEMFNGCTNLKTLGFDRMDNMTAGSNLFLNVTLDTADWSNLLVGLEAHNTDLDCILAGGNSLHNAAGATAITGLTGRSPGWTITDGGLAP